MKKIMAAAVISIALLTTTVQAEDTLTPNKPLANQTLVQKAVSLWHEFIHYF
jgi:hypothetical protein